MYATLALFSLCLCTPVPYTGPSFCCGKNHESDVSLFLKIMMVEQFILFLFLDSHIIMASLWCDHASNTICLLHIILLDWI